MNKPNKFTYIKYFIKSASSVILYKLFKIKPKDNKIGKIKNITMEMSNSRIIDMIKSGKPFAAIRYGGTELSAINNYEKVRLGITKKYNDKVKYALKNNGGFFPTTDKNIEFYGKYMLNNLHNADILGITGLHMENYFYQKYTNNALPIQNWALDPLLGSWTSHLKGKRVLVISPLAQQIKDQYEKRKVLFGTDEVLPEFELMCLEAVQSAGEASDKRFENWFNALDYMKIQILKFDFDIALVGAGAYGSPLCLYIKELGKQALQTGGATQLLFGIIGKRWENRPYVVKYINSHWVRPLNKPEGYKNIENGCYW